MTVLASSLFIVALIFALSTIMASFKASSMRIMDIIENERMPAFASPTIRIGETKHYKMALAPEVAEDNVVTLPLNLTNGSPAIELAKAA